MKYETQNTGIENMRYDFMPVGSIVPFASDIIPLGWLLCDGAPIERSRYPELYDLIGDKLPDHRGMFLRGNDNGRGIDAGRILGSEQGDAIRNITGDLSVRIGNVLNHDILMPDEMAFYTKKKGSFGGSTSRVVSLPESPLSELSILTMDVSRVVPTAEENRPKNNSVNYIIKALHIANPSMEYQVADGLNHKIETNLIEMREAELNNTGVHIGYNGIKYIQDTGDKVAGKLYYDKLQSGLFYCKANTSATVNSDTYFTDYSNYATGNKLANISVVGGETLHNGGLVPGSSVDASRISSLSGDTLLLICVPNTTQTTDGNSSNMTTIVTVDDLRVGVTFYIKNENPDSTGNGCFFVWKLLGSTLKNVTTKNGSSFYAETVLVIKKLEFRFQ